MYSTDSTLRLRLSLHPGARTCVFTQLMCVHEELLLRLSPYRSYRCVPIPVRVKHFTCKTLTCMLYMYNHITYASKCCSSQFNISNALLVEVCLLALLALYSILTVAGAQHQQPTVFGNRFHVFWAFFTAPSCPTPQQRLARRLLFRGDTLDRPWGDTSTAQLTRRVPRA